MTQTLVQKLCRIKPADDVAADGHGGEKSLERSLGVFSLAMIGVGATIGTGIFFTMAEAVPKAGPSVILSFLIAAVT
ncbi:MAG: amino acid permease, partial [Burkholderiaceae bacterium]